MKTEIKFMKSLDYITQSASMESDHVLNMLPHLTLIRYIIRYLLSDPMNRKEGLK